MDRYFEDELDYEFFPEYFFARIAAINTRYHKTDLMISIPIIIWE